MLERKRQPKFPQFESEPGEFRVKVPSCEERRVRLGGQASPEFGGFQPGDPLPSQIAQRHELPLSK